MASTGTTNGVVKCTSVDPWNVLIGQIPSHGIDHEVVLLAIEFRGIGLGAAIEMARIAKPPQLGV